MREVAIKSSVSAPVELARMCVGRRESLMGLWGRRGAGSAVAGFVGVEKIGWARINASRPIAAENIEGIVGDGREGQGADDVTARVERCGESR